MSPQVTPICRSYCATYSQIGKKTLAFRSQLYRSVAFPNLSTLFCFSYIFWAAKQATCASASLRMCHSEEFAVPARSVSKATVQEQMQLLRLSRSRLGRSDVRSYATIEHSRNTDTFRQSSHRAGFTPRLKKKKNQTKNPPKTQRSLLRHRLRWNISE